MNQKELEAIICEIYSIKEVTSLIRQQIFNFVKQHGYSYKNIGRAFYYYAVVLEKEIKLSGGIGIVPYYMDEALKYFEKEKQRVEKIERLIGAAKKSKNKKRKEIKIKKVDSKRTGIKKINIEEI